MIDDGWDDNAEIELPSNAHDNRPVESQTYHSRSEFSGRRGSRGGQGGFRGSSRNDNEFGRTERGESSNWRSSNNEEAEILNVPSKFVGRIIGKGGSKISELQSESGAKIQVTKESNGDTTVVKLFGDKLSVEKAKNLIEDLTVDKVAFVEVTESHQHQEYKKPATIDWKALLQDCEKAENAEWEKYPPTKKDFYIEHPVVTNMSEDEVQHFRLENNNIVVDRTFKKADSAPISKPCPRFEHAFHNYPGILDEIEKAGFQKPSPIQAQAWPVLLRGEDLIGIAQTGTGKTLAFILPAMIHIDGQPGKREERGGPAVLIMAPTRELALQIDKEIKKYQYKGITSVCLYGGGNRRDQVNLLGKGVDIVIATPGRLNDLECAGHLNVKTVTYVVLDEADRMLDMGFEPQIRKVMYAIRPTRQTVMTSATWPQGVRRLAQSYMTDPIQIYVGSLDLAATHTVTQTVEILQDNETDKMDRIMQFANDMQPDQKAIIFCGKKSRADELASEMVLLGIHCQTIHGDRDQADREQALIDIKNGTVRILIATDVASRGLDIDDITHVINFDFPRNIEEYVHRVGRTGRAGKFGESISFFTRADWGQAKDLINILEEAQQFVPEEIYQMAERFEAWKEKRDKERESGGFRGGGRGGRGGGGGGRFNGGGRRW